MPSTHPEAFLHQSSLARFGHRDTSSPRALEGGGFSARPAPRRGVLARCRLRVKDALFQPTAQKPVAGGRPCTRSETRITAAGTCHARGGRGKALWSTQSTRAHSIEQEGLNRWRTLKPAPGTPGARPCTKATEAEPGTQVTPKLTEPLHNHHQKPPPP